MNPTERRSRTGNVALCVAGLAMLIGAVAPSLFPAYASKEPTPGTNSRETHAKGASDWTYSPPRPSFDDVAVSYGQKTLASLSVVALLAGGAFVYARFRKQTPPSDVIPQSRRLRLVETLSLGNHSCLHLVRVGEQNVLVGMDGQGVRILQAIFELPEAESENAIRIDANDVTRPSQSNAGDQ